MLSKNGVADGRDSYSADARWTIWTIIERPRPYVSDLEAPQDKTRGQQHWMEERDGIYVTFEASAIGKARLPNVCGRVAHTTSEDVGRQREVT